MTFRVHYADAHGKKHIDIDARTPEEARRIAAREIGARYILKIKVKR